MAASPRERVRLRISLDGSDPEIWRTLDVDGGLRLDELHEVIQIVMGWRDVHLHEFHTDDRRWSTRRERRSDAAPPPSRSWVPTDQLDEARDAVSFGPDDANIEVLDEHAESVASVFESFEGPLWYTYDFGDGWLHLIELIEREPFEAEDGPNPRRAHLVRGDRRGPLEDSGGIHGYTEFIARVANPVPFGEPGWEEDADLRAWIDHVSWPVGGFDPDRFDAASVDRELALRFDERSDLSGLIGPGSNNPGSLSVDAMPLSPDAPVVAVVERLAPGWARELRIRLRSTGALAWGGVEADLVDAAERAVRPYRWLLDAVGSAGIELTKAGWMPPALVLAGMTELGWRDDWIGTANREDQTWPMRELRESAQHLRLVRVFKGRLLRTPAARAVGDDPVALLRLIAAQAVARAANPAAADALVLFGVELACGDRAAAGGGAQLGRLGRRGRSRAAWLGAGDSDLELARLDAVAAGLDHLEWMRRDERPLEDDDVFALLGDLLAVFSAFKLHDLDADDARRVEREFGRGLLGVG